MFLEVIVKKFNLKLSYGDSAMVKGQLTKVGAEVSLGQLAQINILGISEDSRKIKKNYIFVALKGQNTHGKDFIKAAQKNGAVAVLTEDDFESNLPILKAENLRPLMAQIAAFIYNYPSEKLKMVGLTGTNGKTTCSYLLESVLKENNVEVGVLGTVNFRWAGEEVIAINTTPEGTELNYFLKTMLENKVETAILEVSSHALALGRLESLKFDIVLFNNLSRDHLDFHENMENYFQAKLLLFEKHLKNNAFIVVNIDDKYGKRIKEKYQEKVISFSLTGKADICGQNLILERNFLSFNVVSEKFNMSWKQKSPLQGLFNAYNLLAVISLALVLKVDKNIIESALSLAKGAPGRLERVGQNNNYLVLVDYAHTPEALAEVLKTLKEISLNKILLLFGCGGDRDKGKRPLMAKIAEKKADVLFICSDNPRTENPNNILKDIENGLEHFTSICNLKLENNNLQNVYHLEENRELAIKKAIKIMQKGDILLIAGKGHENYQIINREKTYFHDVEIAEKYLKEFNKF